MHICARRLILHAHWWHHHISVVSLKRESGENPEQSPLL